MTSYRPRRAAWRLLIAAVCVAALPAAADAQYFGANKVQYERFRFQVMETEHFDIYFHLEEREAMDVSARLAERWWQRLSGFFGREPRGRLPIVLYGSHVDFEQTLIVPDLIDPGTGGFTEPHRRRIVMPLAGPLGETDHVLGHELVHVFQFDVLTGTERQTGRDTPPIPLWFIEGLAEYLSLGPVNAHTAMWLRDAVRHENLPTVSALDRPGYFPYRWGHAFWAYVGGRWGDRSVANLFIAAATVGVPRALVSVLGVDSAEFSKDWHAAIREAYPPPAEGAGEVGRVLVAGRPFGGVMNVGPALSPDGRWVAFLSERAFFSIDLFVADASTGQIAAKLTDTAADPHYSNLQFIGSAAAWDRAGRRIAVGAVTGGRAALAIFAWPGGAREREVVIPDVDEIHNPTWSPDGRAIAFSAMSGGVTDLFVYDLEGAALRRLTRDAFADLQPAWEPDGSRIAFVTDRFTTDTAALEFGDYRLALIDAASGSVQAIPAFEAGKHISPQWSPDGRMLYFIGDPDGTSNLYRVDLARGTLARITDAATGVSGITASSPALSIAARDGRAVVTVYESSRFGIHTHSLDGDEPVEATSVLAALPLPPIEAPRRGPVNGWPDDPVPAPPAQPPTVSPYKPRLQLDRITQGAIGVGVDRLGATVGTGIGMAFSDMLNTHQLIAAVQINGAFGGGMQLRDTAAYGAYVNRMHRWNWGLIGSHVPFYRGIRSSIVYPGAGVAVPILEVIRQTERAGTMLTTYALDRARRLEFQGGVSRLSFDRYVSMINGDIEWERAADSLTLGSTSAAFVSDTTSYGGTSVVRGERYRLEAASTVGTIRFLNVLADYRRYFMPVPFYTIAGRALHVARYGSGADDPRVAPLYLGYPSLVRGYGVDANVAAECVVPLATCEDLDHMLGNRLAVGNLELRFPLLRPFGASSRMYGPVIPVEVGLFVDGGLVWRDAARAGATTTRSNAWSAGVALRANLLGFGITEFDIVRPFSSAQNGWVFQFNLIPAF